MSIKTFVCFLVKQVASMSLKLGTEYILLELNVKLGSYLRNNVDLDSKIPQ